MVAAGRGGGKWPQGEGGKEWRAIAQKIEGVVVAMIVTYQLQR